MNIRRVQYQIGCVHNLLFKEEYKLAVLPYFSFERVEYGIDNENTIHEQIRLIFKNENMIIVMKKDGLAFICESDKSELEDENGIMKIFWDLYEKFKLFKGYTKTSSHLLLVHAIEFKENKDVEDILNNNPFLKNPYGKLDEFGCAYEFKKDDFIYKINFGNYSKKDISIQDLRPLKSEATKDLMDKVGLMMRIEINKPEKNPSFKKFVALLRNAEDVIENAPKNESRV